MFGQHRAFPLRQALVCVSHAHTSVRNACETTCFPTRCQRNTSPTYQPHRHLEHQPQLGNDVRLQECQRNCRSVPNKRHHRCHTSVDKMHPKVLIHIFSCTNHRRHTDGRKCKPRELLPANPTWEVNSSMQRQGHNASPQREFMCDLQSRI